MIEYPSVGSLVVVMHDLKGRSSDVVIPADTLGILKAYTTSVLVQVDFGQFMGVKFVSVNDLVALDIPATQDAYPTPGQTLLDLCHMLIKANRNMAWELTQLVHLSPPRLHKTTYRDN
jgi:hypothetical protein